MSIPLGCVRVARGLVGEGLGWFVCDVCLWGMGGWESRDPKLGVV
jgi:hypothetical protein